MTLQRRSAIKSLLAWLANTPRWLQPALFGAAILFAIVAVRMAFVLPFAIASDPAVIIPALVTLGAASAAGAAGGFAYSFLGRPLLRIPLVGRYLTGIICVAAYLTPLLAWSDRIFGDDKLLDFHKTGDVVVWLGAVLLFGIVMGHSWFEPSK